MSVVVHVLYGERYEQEPSEVRYVRPTLRETIDEQND